MTFSTRHNVNGQFDRPSPEAIQREKREQDKAVLDLRRRLAQGPPREGMVLIHAA